MRSLFLGVAAAVVLSSCLVEGSTRFEATTLETTRTFPKGKNMPLGKSWEYRSTRMNPSLLRTEEFKKSSRHQMGKKGHNQEVGGSIWPVSIFWTHINLGTPSKRYAVAIDGGSGAFFISGKNCTGCVTAPPNTPYDPSASSTSVGPYPKPFNASYLTCNPVHPAQPCSIAGPVYTDMVGFSGYQQVPVQIGVIEDQSSNFYQFQTVDGIVGMLAQNGQYGPPKTFANQSVFFQQCIVQDKCAPVWAICFHEGSKSNGTITVGGVDETLAAEPIVYVPSANNTYWRFVTVQNIAVGNNVIPVSKLRNQALLDTGTNDVLLNELEFFAVQRYMCDNSTRKHCNDFFNNASFCASLSESELAAYPHLDFSLENNVTLTLTPKEYFLKNSPAAASPDQVCFGIGNGGSQAEQHFFGVLGDTLMQNYYMVWAEQEIGWAKVNKETCGSV